MSHMTEMFALAHNAEARLDELMKHLKKVIVKRYDEVVIVHTAKTHIAKIYELMEEMK